MLRVSLAARKSKLSSAAPNVAAIDPAWKSVVSAVTESAPVSTAASPPGGVPPDQVIEARLALTVPKFRSKWVKLRLAEAVLGVGLPVVLRNSMARCGPASGVSTGGGGLSWGTSRDPELCAITIAADTGNDSLFAGGAKLIGLKPNRLSEVGVLDPPGAAP